MRRAFLLVYICMLWDVAAAAQINWFVFDLGEKKAQVCSFLGSHPNYHVITAKKCPELDDNPTIEAIEEITSQTFHIEPKVDVVKGVEAASEKIKAAVAPEQPIPTKTHTVRMVFKGELLIAEWMTFPSVYFDRIYQQVHKETRFHGFETPFPLDPRWRDKVPPNPLDNGQPPTNMIAGFKKGITRVYLVKYNAVVDGVMTSWIGLDSNTPDEPKGHEADQ